MMKETKKAGCPTCNGDRTCFIYAHVEKKWDWSDQYDNHVHGADKHSLLECCGCETVFYEVSAWNSEQYDQYQDANGDEQLDYIHDITIYPKPEGKRQPAWFNGIARVDRQLSAILEEMYLAYDNHAYILTAVGLRTALDRATEVLNIDATLTFQQKLDALKAGGWIGDSEAEILGVVTDAGNAAAHRGWVPSPDELEQLLSSMEVFLQRAFIVEKEALKIKANIPAKPTRKKKPKKADA